MESGHVADEESTLIEGCENSHGVHRQLHMGEKYLKVKVAPFGGGNCEPQRATIGEIEPIQRNRWKNGSGLSRIRTGDLRCVRAMS